MERIGTLIHKLQEQYQSKIEAQFLLHTAEMLVAELSMQHQQQQVKKRIAVLMPQHFATAEETEIAVQELQETSVVTTTSQIELKMVEEEAKPPMVSVDEFIAPLVKPILQKPTAIFNAEVAEPKKASDKLLFELNDVLVEDEEVINDKLQPTHVEVVSTIKEAPVKDLRKAIGINDKYAFIQFLFKGDEAVYERCIKTINGFNVFPEAEAWIKRELITKMGWIEADETVQQFLYLVKRRFA